MIAVYFKNQKTSKKEIYKYQKSREMNLWW